MSDRQTIQRFPRGLLSALSMKGTGDAPNQLHAELFGSFDCTTFYLGDQIKSVAGGPGVMGAVGWYPGGAAFVVPAGEIWMVTNYTVQVGANGAGTTYKIQLGYVRAIGNVTFFLPGESSSAIGELTLLGFQFANWQLMLYPGDSLGLAVRGGTFGVPAAPGLSVGYYRLEI